MKKISVILPVYNGEKYLHRCIDSVLSQEEFDINELEIIAINDGSTDKSLEILNAYKRAYEEIFVIVDQPNCGIANTRNKGISFVTGVYTIFIDQDDWIDKDYCRHFYDAIDKNKLDVVSGGYRRPDVNGRVRQENIPRGGGYSKYRIMAAWAKIHRTEFLKQQKIEFFDNRIGEDIPFTIKEIFLAKKWDVIRYCGYNWFYNESSVSNTYQKSLTTELAESIKKLIKAMLELGDNTLYFQYCVVRTTIYCLVFSGRNTRPYQFQLVTDELFTLIEKQFPSIYSNPIIFFGPRAEALNVRIIVLIFVLLRRFRLTAVFARLYCRGK